MLMLALSRQADKSVILTRQQSLESQQFVGVACAECRVFSNGRVLPCKLFNYHVFCGKCVLIAWSCCGLPLSCFYYA